MEKIFKLAIIVVLLAVGYSYGRPYLEGLIDTGGSGTQAGGQCSRQVSRARDDFADKMRSATPPVNIERWNSGFAMSQGRLNQARDSCNCAGEGCAAGQDAIEALDRLMQDWDSALQSNSAPPLNGARSLEAIERLIDEARQKGA